MTLLAPDFLFAAIATACGIIALHFIVTRRPRSTAFPTARFVPDVPVAARTRATQFSDLLLLAVRVLTLLCVGAALARPVLLPRRFSVVRVIAADVSGSVASMSEVRDSVRALFRSGDALVLFDTAARSVASVDSIADSRRSPLPGSLSAGLIAALRAGSRVRDGADSIELVIVSPVTTTERDRATSVIRARWPGRVRLVRIAPSTHTDAQAKPAPVIRFAAAARPQFAVARNLVDTVGAVAANGNVVVAPFERRWRFTAESLAHAHVIARWIDGDPAAIERDSASSCTRSLVVPFDSAGDMSLRPSFIRFRASLSAPCLSELLAPDAALSKTLIGVGSLARAVQFSPSPDINSPLARWLAVIALVLAIVEMVLRRARGRGSEQ